MFYYNVLKLLTEVGVDWVSYTHFSSIKHESSIKYEIYNEMWRWFVSPDLIKIYIFEMQFIKTLTHCELKYISCFCWAYIYIYAFIYIKLNQDGYKLKFPNPHHQ